MENYERSFPTAHGWDINQDNMLETEWSESPTLPQAFADLVHDSVGQQDEENDSDYLYLDLSSSDDELENSSRDLSQYTGLGTA